jgi:hypothetical protein
MKMFHVLYVMKQTAFNVNLHCKEKYSCFSCDHKYNLMHRFVEISPKIELIV